MKKAQEDWESIPDTITEEEYKRVQQNKESVEDWYRGFVGFLGSFASKYFAGFARRRSKRRDGRKEDVPAERIRSLKAQASNLKGIIFTNHDYKYFSNVKGAVIYCDPPYSNTTSYKGIRFSKDEFCEWCREMAKNNVVIISEYEMPEDFECIWEKELPVSIDSGKKSWDTRKEKLFIKKNIDTVNRMC